MTTQKPTITQPLFPGDRATAPMALEDTSDTAWKQFEELLSAKDMGFEGSQPPSAPAASPTEEAQLEDSGLVSQQGYEETQALGIPAPAQAQVVPTQAAPVKPPAKSTAVVHGRAIEVNDAMTLARRNNRACPVPPQWAEFHKLLPVREQQGRRIPPPPPIEGTAWSASSPMQKRLRLRDQIEWADRTGALEAAYQFLAALPEDQWHHF